MQRQKPSGTGINVADTHSEQVPNDRVLESKRQLDVSNMLFESRMSTSAPGTFNLVLTQSGK